MKIKLLILLILFITHFNFTSKAQVSSRNGYWFSNNGTIRILLVFAETIDDPADTYSYSSWPRSQMPLNPNFFLDQIINSANINGLCSKIFYQASFGNLKVVGDYYPKLVRIKYSAIKDTYGIDQVVDYLDSLPVVDCKTAHGLSFCDNSFDLWSNSGPNNFGLPKSNISNNMNDLILVIYRVNSKYRIDVGGMVDPTPYLRPIQGKLGFDAKGVIVMPDGSDFTIFRHEFAHTILGGGAMHSVGGGAGNRTFMSVPGGYSLLSSSGAIGESYNGFDRYRLGWKPSFNTNYISARKANDNTEINSDLVYGQAFPGNSNEYIIRDFITNGDAIRIKLPYLKTTSTTIRDQWLWIENRQMKEGNIDLHMIDTKGLYAYIQIGKDDLTNFSDYGSNNNYLFPLHSFGNYDMRYELTSLKSTNDYIAEFSQFGEVIENESNVVDKISFSTINENPFTGYNILMKMAYNTIEPNIIQNTTGPKTIYDNIFRKEIIIPYAVEFNGELLPSTDFYSSTIPGFGSRYDAFKIGNKISLGSNPATTPVLTYLTIDNDIQPLVSRSKYDNSIIFLNGLSIEVLEQRANGDIKVKIRWDDFDVNANVRWCGPIVLNEKVFLKLGKTITLDQGLTPTKPVNPMIFNGEKIFADYTTFTSKTGSLLRLESTSKMEAKNKSVIILESGSTTEINESSVLNLQAGSTLHIKNGANLTVKGAGRLVIDEGAYVCVENGAIINLLDNTSYINLLKNSLNGVNPLVITNTGTCTASLLNYPVTGTGKIKLPNYIQNLTFSGTQTLSGAQIFAGTNVTSSLPQGPVKITSSANVVFESSYDITISGDFQVDNGAIFEIKKL